MHDHIDGEENWKNQENQEDFQKELFRFDGWF